MMMMNMICISFVLVVAVEIIFEPAASAGFNCSNLGGFVTVLFRSSDFRAPLKPHEEKRGAS